MDDEKLLSVSDLVSRTRRYSYIRNTSWAALVVAVSLTVAAGMGVFTSNQTMLETTVEGLLSLAMALGLSYVGGSVIDYNGGLKNTVMGSNNHDRRRPDRGAEKEHRTDGKG